jgi:hypothetical protein
MNNWQNMGTLDRVLRAIAGIVLVAVGALAGLGTAWSVVTFGVAALMLGTAAVGFCPAYLPLRLNTGARPTQSPRPA